MRRLLLLPMLIVETILMLVSVILVICSAKYARRFTDWCIEKLPEHKWYLK